MYLRLALAGSFCTSGDQRYRLHQSAAALARQARGIGRLVGEIPSHC